MRKSLLGHLYTHIKGSAEDVATMSLQYLLTYYDSLRESFNELLADRLSMTFDNNTSYECQSVGDDLERPNMAGTDTEGNEIILCEMKFYAGLTSNQPLTYLRRLKDEKGNSGWGADFSLSIFSILSEETKSISSEASSRVRSTSSRVIW